MARRALWIISVIVFLSVTAQHAGAQTCAQQEYDAIVAVLMDPTIWSGPDGPIFTAQSVPDHNGNQIRDDYDLALACRAMCQYPEAQATYDSNYAIAEARAIQLGRHVVGWATLAASYGFTTAGAGLMNYWGVPGLTPWTYDSQQPVAGGAADYDRDGLTNKQEYDLIRAQNGTQMDYAIAASGGPGEDEIAACIESKRTELFAAFVGAGVFTLTEDGPDHNWNGIPDKYEVALLAVAVCREADAVALYEANLAGFMAVIGNYAGWGYGENQAVVGAAYATMNAEGDTAVRYMLWISDAVYSPWDAAKVASQPLAHDGDYDGDGFTNLEEYQMVLTAPDPDPILYAALASVYVGQFWPGNPALPVAGVAGLVALATAFGLGGIVSLRKMRRG